MANKPIPWTDTEVNLLNEKYPTSSKEELIKIFPNRSYKSIAGKAEKIGLKKEEQKDYWDDVEIDLLLRYYSHSSKEEILTLLPNKDWYQIQRKSSKLGVRKYKEYDNPRHSWTIEEIISLVESRGYIYHDTYFDSFNKRKLIVECEKGIVSHVFFNSFRKGSEAGSLSKTRKKNFSEIKEMIESDGYILITNENEYENSKSRLNLICPNGHNYETNATNFSNGNRCSTCHLEIIGKDNLLDFSIVAERFKEKGFILEETQDYLGGSVKMKCNCVNHQSEEFTLELSYNQVVNMNVKCVHCRKEQRVFQYKKNFEDTKIDFTSKGLHLKTTEEEYVQMRQNVTNGNLVFLCGEHSYFGEQSIKLRSYRGNTSICKYCAKKKISGENHHNWVGGVSKISEYLRQKIQPWKFDSFKYYNFRCFLTNRTDELVIHHKYPFSEIVKESLIELDIPIKENVSEYSDVELEALIEHCLQKHYEHGLGVCLTRDAHELFHAIYSMHNFTENDFDDFVKRYRSGEFNESKEAI